MSISIATRKVLEAFQQENPGFANPRLQDELGRFRIWAGNVSAHRPKTSRRSLEYRLRDSSTLQERVLSLLQDLQTALASLGKSDQLPDVDVDSDIRSSQPEPHGTAAGTEDVDSDDDLFVVDDEEPPTTAELLDQEVDEVHEVINCLMRFSVALRNPARHDQVRVGSSTKWFEPYDIQHVKAKFPQAPDYLVQRLGKAISRHRQYFKYRREHHEKLAEGLDPVQEAEERPSTIATSLRLPVAKAPVSELPLLDTDDIESVATATSYAGTESGSDAHLRPPEWPEAGQQGLPFECPICYGFIEADTERSWQQHVYEDMPPYICVQADCTTGDKTYARRKDWLHHTSSVHHRHWICPYGCEQSFESLSKFEAHLSQSHGQTFGAVALQNLADTCGRPSEEPETHTCVLCSKEYPNSKRLYKHLSHHLEQLTLFALPKDLVGEDSEEDISDDSGDAMDLSVTNPVFARALYTYEGKDDTELSFHEGDLIRVRQKSPNGWWYGYLNEERESFKNGWFPSKSCQEIVQAKDLEPKAALEGRLPLDEETQSPVTDNEAALPPISFIDFLGRRFSFPWQLCKTWSSVEPLILQAFSGLDTFERIKDGHYYLTGPDDEIILPEVWDVQIQPGWKITMSLWPELEPELESLFADFGYKTPNRNASDHTGGNDRIKLDYIDQLARFHKQNGHGLNRFPSINKRPIDLYNLGKIVEHRGGFEQVCKDEGWGAVARHLEYSGKSMSSLSAFLRNSYQKWLLPYEDYLRLAKPDVQQQPESLNSGQAPTKKERDTGPDEHDRGEQSEQLSSTFDAYSEDSVLQPIPEDSPVRKEVAEATKDASSDDADHAPIRFTDDFGRRMTFAWQSCKSWQGMERLILQAFSKHPDVVSTRVRKGQYNMLGPDGTIILPEVWEDTIKPGWAITMHLWSPPDNETTLSSAEPPAGPILATYCKIHKQNIATETLDHYGLPYGEDNDDPEYFVIYREMDENEITVLFEHTNRLQSGKSATEPKPADPGPIYPRVLKQHLDVRTLEYYDIRYEDYKDDPEYLVILREMDEDETEVLFEHTKRLRSQDPPLLWDSNHKQKRTLDKLDVDVASYEQDNLDHDEVVAAIERKDLEVPNHFPETVDTTQGEDVKPLREAILDAAQKLGAEIKTSEAEEATGTRAPYQNIDELGRRHPSPIQTASVPIEGHSDGYHAQSSAQSPAEVVSTESKLDDARKAITSDISRMVRKHNIPPPTSIPDNSDTGMKGLISSGRLPLPNDAEIHGSGAPGQSVEELGREHLTSTRSAEKPSDEHNDGQHADLGFEMAPTSTPASHSSPDTPLAPTEPEYGMITEIRLAEPHHCGQIDPNTNEPCNADFWTLQGLHAHENMIHSSHFTMFRCPICRNGLEFSTNGELKKHMRNHKT